MSTGALTFMIIFWGLIISCVVITLKSILSHEKKNK